MRHVSPARPGSTNLRWALLLAPLLVLAMLVNLALYPAQAAQLPISDAKITTVTVADRCTHTVAVTHGAIANSQATTVTVSGLVTRCNGRVLALTLFGTGGTAIVTATVPPAQNVGDSVTVTVPGYSPAAVTGAAVTVGSWGVPAGWTYTPPADLPLVSCRVVGHPLKTCTITNIKLEFWGHPTLDTYNMYFDIETLETTEVVWEATVNLAHLSMQVVTSRMDSNNNVVLGAGWGCQSMPTLVLRGQATSGYATVSATTKKKDRTVWLQGASKSSRQVDGNFFNCH